MNKITLNDSQLHEAIKDYVDKHYNMTCLTTTFYQKDEEREGDKYKFTFVDVHGRPIYDWERK